MNLQPSSFEEATDLNKILQFLIDNRTNSPDACSIHEKLLPSKPFEYVHNLCFIIQGHQPELVKARVYTPRPGHPADCFYISNSYTAPFLHSGGFVSIFEQIDYANRIEEEKQRLSMEKLRFETKMVKWKYRTYWIVAIAGIIGFFLSIYNAFWKK